MRPAKAAAVREQFLREAVLHLDHLYRVAFHLALERDEAEDLVQETYARAIGCCEQFNLGSNMKAWLSKILYNLFLDRYRERKRWLSTEQNSSRETDRLDDNGELAAENPGPEHYTLLKELNSKINAALRKLPEEFRTPIILVDMNSFSYMEAAQVLSCPVGTIRSRVSRGRKLLRGYLKAYVATESK